MYIRRLVVAATLACSALVGCGGNDDSDSVTVPAGRAGAAGSSGGAAGSAGNGAGGFAGDGTAGYGGDETGGYAGDTGNGGAGGFAGDGAGGDADGGLGGFAGGDVGAPDGGAGAGGFAGAAGAPGDLGEGDGHDVIFIGDSWMNLGIGVGIQQSVVKASGGRPYRLFGVPGTKLLDGVIPAQYDAAKKQNPDIKTIVMTGGGNDILLDPFVIADCLNLGPSCKKRIDDIGAKYAELADKVAADGVHDVIIVVYTRNTLLGPKAIDYVFDKIRPVCDKAPLHCVMVDSDTLGEKMVTREGIHPTDAGYDLIGKAVYKVMVDQGMRR